nr:HNH endonuclease signature motif containing protein [uncultured Comamonas sp.]
MNPTLKALLSRNIPRVLAKNLVIKKMTLGKLVEMDDSDLKTLGLQDSHIKSIRGVRPSIPVKTLRKILEDSWDTCCVCTKRERDIVIHHIKEWGQGGTHDEANLAALCLEDHHRTHLSGGHAKATLTATDIRSAKEKWIKRAKKLRDNHHRALLDPFHWGARWLWIHLDRLRALAEFRPSPIGTEKQFLFNNGFIDEAGRITAETQWNEVLAKAGKDYVFDSSNGQRMAMYVSGVLAHLLQSYPVMDITDMLENREQMSRYIEVGQLVFFRSHIDIQKNPADYPQNDRWLQATVNKTDLRLTFTFDLWTSLSMTAKGSHLPTEAERSVVAEVVSVTTAGPQTRIQLTPLGISPDFLPHDPSQGAFVKGANNADFRKRRKSAKVD